MTSGLPARRAALSIFSQVLRQRVPLSRLLWSPPTLSPRDAAFARALVSDALRHFGELEAAIRHLAPKPLPPHKSGLATEILLLGACELLILKTPAHAAVDAANDLAASDSETVHFKPLVNAVLRRLAREAGKIAYDGSRLNTPDWLWNRWCAQYGDSKAREIARANGRQAPLDIHLRDANAIHPQSVKLFGLSRRVTAEGRVDDLLGFKEGGWWVQDAAASLPAVLLGDVAGRNVFDLCAAPGGKTLGLASQGADVVAVEIDSARMRRVRENLARTGLNARLIECDLRDFEGEAPLVLLDAPCTATGTIRRHPDIPWIRNAADVTAQASQAYDLMEGAARLVAQGGLLVFAVCSLEREEAEDQAALFLAGHREFSRVPVEAREIFGHSEWITPQGDLRTLPCDLAQLGGMDGFYAARFRRVSPDR
ncbi:MAG: RsmB/NOP family class I SAM-dependent RNA methyltransferase [Rhizomicrobium sp.]